MITFYAKRTAMRICGMPNSGFVGLLGFLVGLTVFQQPTLSAEVWLSGMDPVTRAAHADWGESDFMKLFSPNAAWQTAASKVNVFKVSTQFLMRAPDEQLNALFSGLRARNIKLAVELGFLTGDGRCGVGMEGYAAPGTAGALARRVHRLAGTVDYVAMDEPLWFGKYANKPTSCHSSLDELVREISAGVSQLVAVFPDVKIGDIEPIGVPNTIPWPEEIERWIKTFRSGVGTNLAFLHADVQWRSDWRSQMSAITAKAVAAHLPFGVIVDSDRPDTSDIAWTEHAEASLQEVRSLIGHLPDAVIFQSWTLSPRRFLPDTENGTLTNMVARFRN